MLDDRLEGSERRACRYAGQHRSTQRHAPLVAGDDAGLWAALRQISRDRPWWGYQRAHQLLLEQGSLENAKRMQRLWREEGLRLVPQRRRKRQRLGDSTVPAKRLRALAPDDVWALDFQFDQTDGRIVKLLHVVDEFPREALAIEWQRRIDADKTVARLDCLVAQRGSAPALIRWENVPKLFPHAVRDWWRLSRAGSAYNKPNSRQNPYVESFGSRVRDELLWARAALMRCRGQGAPRGLASGIQRAAALSSWDHGVGSIRDRVPGGPSNGRVRRRRTALPLRARCIPRRRQPYLADQPHPPALTAGGPMNGVRSGPVRRYLVER